MPREWVRCWCTLWKAFHSVIPDLCIHSVHLLCVVIPKDWQVFLVMDLLPSVDPLMGGVFWNSRGGVGWPAPDEHFQFICVYVCI